MKILIYILNINTKLSHSPHNSKRIPTFPPPPPNTQQKKYKSTAHIYDIYFVNLHIWNIWIFSNRIRDHTAMNDKKKQLYLDFEAYERVAEPHKREKAEAWRAAIGLQDVDRVKVSE